MNKILKILLIVTGFVVAVILLSMTVIFILPKTSLNCLEDYANDYCADLGYTRHSSDNRNGWFRCSKNHNARSKNYDYKDFYFLDKELSNCRIKDSFTFKDNDRFVGVGEQ